MTWFPPAPVGDRRGPPFWTPLPIFLLFPQRPSSAAGQEGVLGNWGTGGRGTGLFPKCLLHLCPWAPPAWSLRLPGRPKHVSLAACRSGCRPWQDPRQQLPPPAPPPVHVVPVGGWAGGAGEAGGPGLGPLLRVLRGACHLRRDHQVAPQALQQLGRWRVRLGSARGRCRGHVEGGRSWGRRWPQQALALCWTQAPCGGLAEGPGQRPSPVASAWGLLEAGARARGGKGGFRVEVQSRPPRRSGCPGRPLGGDSGQRQRDPAWHTFPLRRPPAPGWLPPSSTVPPGPEVDAGRTLGGGGQSRGPAHGAGSALLYPGFKAGVSGGRGGVSGHRVSRPRPELRRPGQDGRVSCRGRGAVRATERAGLAAEEAEAQPSPGLSPRAGAGRQARPRLRPAEDGPCPPVGEPAGGQEAPQGVAPVPTVPVCPRT